MPEEIPDNEVQPSEEPKSVAQNIKSRPIWLRLFFMLVISFIWGVTRIVIGAVVVLQFFWVLFTSDVNQSLQKFGQQLAVYSLQIIRYLTFVCNERPFPFDLEWPDDDTQ
ncbi:MAG: DUF4389 domain-containing protein [Pseudomonadales bacterium]